MQIKSFFAILATSLLCACSQYEAETEQQPATGPAMSFEIGGLSRAEIRNLQNVYDDGFQFTCTQEGYEIASNAKATWNGEYFNTRPPLFWPAELEKHPYLFHAISCPQSENITIVRADGKSTFDYTVPLTAFEQKDVVVASVLATKIPALGVLQIPFTHAFTKVNFSIHVDEDAVNEGYVWRVTSISLAAKNEGTYTFDEANPWTVKGGLVDMQYLNEDQVADVANAKPWDGQNNFMLIPQTGDLTLTVTWAVYRKLGEDLLIKQSHMDAVKEFTISADDWKPNGSIRYSKDLRLPSIGEDTKIGAENLDDNNMLIISYDPNCS